MPFHNYLYIYGDRAADRDYFLSNAILNGEINLFIFSSDGKENESFNRIFYHEIGHNSFNTNITSEEEYDRIYFQTFWRVCYPDARKVITEKFPNIKFKWGNLEPEGRFQNYKDERYCLMYDSFTRELSIYSVTMIGNGGYKLNFLKSEIFTDERFDISKFESAIANFESSIHSLTF